MLKINILRTFSRFILGARTALFVTLSLILLACSGEKKENGAKDCAPLPSLEYSKNLKIGESCGERVAEIRSIVGRDTLVRRFSLEKPLSRVVAQSSAQIGYLLKLGLGERIVGVSEGQYIADSALYTRVQKGEVAEVGSGNTLSLEKLVALKPELVMNFATGAGYDDYERIDALGLPLMLTSEWQEDHPLAKAEWIKLYGVLFGVEELADSIYKQSKIAYKAATDPSTSLLVSRSLPRIEPVPNLFRDSGAQDDTLPTSDFLLPTKSCPRVIAGMSYGGVWYAPGGRSYTAQLIRDAGGCYLWAKDSSRELRFTLEEIIVLADSVDVWFNPGMFSTPDEILATEPRIAAIKAFREKRVYQNDARKGPQGGNDFYESAVVSPEKVLEDFVQILKVGKDAEKVDSGAEIFRWYRNIFIF